MTRMHHSKWLIIGMLISCFIFPRAVMATGVPEPATNPSSIRDVALKDGGILIGRVVDTNNVPQAKVPVSLIAGDRQLAVGMTDEQGYFAFRGLKGGVYHLVSAKGLAAYRVWAPEVAPPNAQPGALVVAGQDLVRGQFGGRLGMILTHPLVIAGAVATAVAVPIAIAAADDDEEPPATP